MNAVLALQQVSLRCQTPDDVELRLFLDPESSQDDGGDIAHLESRTAAMAKIVKNETKILAGVVAGFFWHFAEMQTPLKKSDTVAMAKIVKNETKILAGVVAGFFWHFAEMQTP